MAQKADCTDHTIAINNLKKDMETRIRHEERLTKTIENLDILVDKLNENYFKINSSLSHLADIPDRLRKVEDKSIAFSLIEKGLWFVVGVGISVIIQQKFVATTKEEEQSNYSISKNK